MTDRDIYVLPTKEKKKLTRRSYIVLCLALATVVLALMNVITFLIHGDVVGYFPLPLVLVVADILHFAGCIYYISKHDFAYGSVYEKYQIVNATIYGIQWYLRVLLAVMLISFLIIPLYIIIILALAVIAMFRWTRRLWK